MPSILTLDKISRTHYPHIWELADLGGSITEEGKKYNEENEKIIFEEIYAVSAYIKERKKIFNINSRGKP